MLVTAANTGAFALDRLARLGGGSVSGLPGYEDFVRLALGGAALMFFPHAQARRGHVAVDIFVSWLPAGIGRLLDRLWLAATIAIALFLAWWMWVGMGRARADALVTGVLGWPDWPFYLPGIASLVPLGGGGCHAADRDAGDGAAGWVSASWSGSPGLPSFSCFWCCACRSASPCWWSASPGTMPSGLAAPFLRFEPYLAQFKTLLWGAVSNYDLSVVPLFILMGYLASRANLARDLFQGAAAALGSLRGGVAMAAVGACGGFGAVCGSSLATAATMGRVALPELKRLNYAPRLATGALAAGGTLGILIPPSVALVLYAIITEASIIEMFQAAVIPGLIAVLFFVGAIAVQVRLDPSLAPEPERPDPAERRAAYRRLIPVLLIFGTIILGLGFGFFTPTPAAAIGAFVVLAYGVGLRVVTGEGLGIDGILDALRQTAVTSGMIYLILFGAEVLKGFFGRSDLPGSLAGWAAGSGLDPWLLLVLMLVVLVLLGCFMDSLAMILVVLPFLWPVLTDLNGGDFATAETAAYGLTTPELKVWFGILALIVVELGLITPPVGLNVFVISSIDRGDADGRDVPGACCRSSSSSSCASR